MTRSLHSLPASAAVGLAIATMALGIVTIPAGDAWPHQIPGHDHGVSYAPECCNSAATSPTGDCAPIEDQYVTEGPDGYIVELPAGAHPRLKTHSYSSVIPYSGVRQPVDNSYHICLANEGAFRFCFFPKPGAV